MADRILRGDEEIEVERFARVISNALDDALIVTGLVPADQCRPFDMLSKPEQDAIRLAAKNVYLRLAIRDFNTITVVAEGI